MKQPLYLTKAGTLKRKGNTLIFIPSGEDEKRYIPIEQVSSIYALSSLEINSALVNFLSQHSIPIHYFNYYGTYMASVYPREQDVSGLVVIRQAEHYLDTAKRLIIAQEMVDGIIKNLIRVLRYYANRLDSQALKDGVETLSQLLDQTSEATSIDELRGIEGKSRDVYFSQWNDILSSTSFVYAGRQRRPPADPLNALISWGNTLLYATVIGEILHVHLHGGISYMHEPGRYRFSLALDLADIFKPVFVDRLIFKLVNHKIIKEKHFVKHFGYALLNDQGKRIFITHWEEMMKRTVKHITLKRNVSMRRLIRLECYKLIKHFLGEQPYRSFKMWWQ